MSMMMMLLAPLILYIVGSINRWMDRLIDITELKNAADKIVESARSSSFGGKLIRALDAISNKYDGKNVSGRNNDDDDYDVDDDDDDNNYDDDDDYDRDAAADDDDGDDDHDDVNNDDDRYLMFPVESLWLHV